MCLTSAPLDGFVGLEWPELPKIDFGETELPRFNFSSWFSGRANALESSGKCGENVTYTYDASTGELVISGTGPMPDYDSPFDDSDIKSVIIGEGITSIGSYTFRLCKKLTNIKIADSVTNIGHYAFYNCSGLTSITMPASLQLNSSNVFTGCTNITDIVLSKGNGIMPFYNYRESYYKGTPWYISRNNKLNITLEDGITNIGNATFYQCTGLSNIIIPDSVTTIGGYAFEGCENLIQIDIPDNVADIGGFAFKDCTSLSNIVIPNSIKSIGYCTFANCKSLTSIVIPEGVITIEPQAFANCEGLKNVKMPANIIIEKHAFTGCGRIEKVIISKGSGVMSSYFDSYMATPWYNTKMNNISIIIEEGITNIGAYAFRDCNNLESIVIPSTVTNIGWYAFDSCYGMRSITLPSSVTKVGYYAFVNCDNLKDVYYYGTKDQWLDLSVDIRNSTGNDALLNATIHFLDATEPDYSNISIGEDLVFLDINDEYQFKAYSGNGIDITNSLIWNVSDLNVAEVVSPGCIRAKKEGLITVSAERSYSERDFCYVYVGDSTHIEYNTIYDKDYYYSGDGFFSNAAQISNAVDIYLSLENSVAEDLQLLYDKDPILNTYEDEFKTLKEIEEFTITATVSGNDLSFSKDGYSNTYSETFNNIPIETIADDILMLYPYKLSVSGNKKSYTVKVKIESDDFETIEDTITFSVSDLKSKAANDHIDYLNSNAIYKASLKNAYGKNMVELKGDLEYIWSKYSTFDFDNYYEIVVADLLIGILNVQKKEEIELLPKMISEFNKLIGDAASTIDTFVSGNFAETVDLTKTSIDKFIKIGEYRTNDKYAENAMFKAIQKLGGDKVNADKLKNVFQVADKTKQVCKYLSFGLDTINNLRDYSNRISAFNAYSAASDSLKQVLEKLHDSIPITEHKMRDALKDFINFADDGTKINAETVEALSKLGAKVGLDAFTTVLGKGYVELLSGTVCEWVGMFKNKSGVLLSSTKEYAAIQAGFGTFATLAGAVAVELCLLDILCDSSDKAAEMSKIVAMSEYTPYVVETIKHYENNLKANKDNNSVDLFENAFAIHKASQVYVVDHTVKALEIKRDSIIENLLNREGEYEQVVADTLSIKSQLADMVCHINDTTSSIVKKTKVVAVKCPVDVLVYDETGNVVVKIINNILEYCADGIEVCISEGEKYICIPDTSEYKINITATDSGSMNYAIFEYDENGDNVRELKYNNISLYNGQNFQGNIGKVNLDTGDKYNLITDSKTIYADEDISKSHEEHEYTTETINATCTSDGVKKYTCACGDSYTETLPATGHNYKVEVKKATLTKNGLVKESCKNCGNILRSETVYKPAEFKLSKTAYNYNGKEKTPSLTIKTTKGDTLVKGKDYTLTMESGRINVGVYTYTITFIGNYSGTKKVSFKILPGRTYSITANLSVNSIKLTWDKVKGATGYIVYQYNPSTGNYKKLNATSTNTYTVNNLKPGTTYKFAVKAFAKCGGETLQAATYMEITVCTKPATPTVKITAGSKKATLSWSKVTGATGYEIFMKNDAGKYVKIGTTSKTTYTKKSLKSGRTYYFRVRACKTLNGINIYSSYKTYSVKVK